MLNPIHTSKLKVASLRARRTYEACESLANYIARTHHAANVSAVWLAILYSSSTSNAVRFLKSITSPANLAYKF